MNFMKSPACSPSKPEFTGHGEDLVHSESSFEKSLEQISVESSESAVEVASLKAQLALEQSKVGRIGCDVTN